MTYDGNSPVATSGRATAFAIQRWFDANAASGAAYVGLPVKAIDAGVGASIVEFATAWNVNADMLAALIAHESAYLQSHISRDKNNPGGYGATNDAPYEKAVTFATMREGIRAVAAHLAGYVHGDGPWNQHSPRYSIVKGNGWAGSVRKLTDLNGKWAHPGTTYGQSLARIASDLVAFAATIVEPSTPFQAVIPANNIKGVPFRASILPSTAPNRVKLPMLRYDGPLIHETGNVNVGANAEMHRRFVHNGGGSENVAFQFVVDDKEIIQLVPLNEGCYHAGNATCNRTRWGIEICINADGNFNKALEHAAKLVQFLWEYAPMTNGKIGQHYDCSGKNCPMKLRTGRWNEFVGMVGTPPGKPMPTPNPNAERFVWDEGRKDFWIVNQMFEGIGMVNMLDFYREIGGLPRLGNPTEGMRMEIIDGKRVFVQETENVRMEFWADGFGNMGAYYRFGRRLPL